MKVYKRTFKLIIGLIVLSLAIFVFFQNSIYPEVKSTIFRLRLSTILALTSISGITLVYLHLIEKLELIWVVQIGSILLYLPSAISFSSIGLLGANTSIFEAHLPFHTILSLGVVILTGNLILHYLNILGKGKSELVDRGATEKDVEKVYSRQFMYISGFFLFSGSLTLGFGLLSQRIESVLSGIITNVPLVHLTIGVGGSLTILITVLLYLKEIRV